MRGGNLDRRITIQLRTVTKNADGEEIETWADLITRYASQKAMKGTEQHTDPQLIGKTFKTFTIRWSVATSAINVRDYRIVFNDRIFNLIDNRELGRRDGLELDGWTRSEKSVLGA